MAGDEKFYGGADYGLDPNYGDALIKLGPNYKFSSSDFGVSTDPRTADQLKGVSDRINTGARAIEITAITPDVVESIPKQHFEELNRLRKISGVDLTFHGPLVEPTGVSRQGWDPTHREQAERQMFDAVEKAHKVNPDGNIVVTFHSSNGLPHPETYVYDKEKGKKIKEVWVVDERTGQFQNLSPKPNYFEGKTEEDFREEITKKNEEAWYRALQHVNFNANQGANIIEGALSSINERTGETSQTIKPKDLLNLYSKYANEYPKAEEIMRKMGPHAELAKDKMQKLVNGDIYLRDSYGELQNLYNQAYDAARKEAERTGNKDNLNKLEQYRSEIKDKLEYLKDPAHVDEFAAEIVKGVNILRSVNAPQTLRPLKDFAIEQSAETFANLALKSYNEFKDKSPIISIENPPVGMGLSNAEDLKAVIKKAQNTFQKKAIEQGLSESEAKEQAEKLIGATWDLGHINMLRKYGFGDKEIVKETKTIAPFVKHLHLSDNFGYEHTELPMGMGNVPTKEHIEALAKYSKQIKKIAETGQWYQHFKKSPLSETFQAFGSPIYGMKNAPYWNQGANASGSYFSGYGQTLPEGHFSLYGAGFSGLPVELGGQLSGRSRLGGGTPME